MFITLLHDIGVATIVGTAFSLFFLIGSSWVQYLDDGDATINLYRLGIAFFLPFSSILLLSLGITLVKLQ